MADNDDTLISESSAGDEPMDTEVTRIADNGQVSDTDVTQIAGEDKTLIQDDNKIQAPNIPDTEIVRELGRGGMGVVYEGRQGYLDRSVAIKVLLKQFTGGSTQFSDRFQREAKILAQLNHPHIVACYQAGVADDGNCFLVMEFIDGSDLEKWVHKKGNLNTNDALGVIKTIGQALRYAHENGIIHRDVKPENILLCHNASANLPFTPKLVDLGLARPDASADMQLTAQGVIMGTPATMAPEQFDDPDNVDLRADIYGLGCVLYYALTGQAAFSGQGLTQLMESKLHTNPPNPQDINPEISNDVVVLIKDMLAKSADDRIQNYDLLIERIDQLLSGTSAAAAPSKKSEPSKSPLPIVIGIMVIVIVGLVIGLGGGNGNNQEQTQTPEIKQDPIPKVHKPAVTSEQVLIQAGQGLGDWWSKKNGIWGPEETGAGIVGFAKKDETAHLELKVDQAIQSLNGIVGGMLDEGKTSAFDALEIHLYFADGSEWLGTLNDLGFDTIAITMNPPKTSAASLKSSSLVPPREWPLSIKQSDDGWSITLGSVEHKLRAFTQKITSVEFCVKNGNCFLRDLVLNKKD